MAMPGYTAGRDLLKYVAFEALRGVGNPALGQWEEWNHERVYVVKRRLTSYEQKDIGSACDIRGTPEAEQRRAAMLRLLPDELRDWQE